MIIPCCPTCEPPSLQEQIDDIGSHVILANDLDPHVDVHTYLTERGICLEGLQVMTRLDYDIKLGELTLTYGMWSIYSEDPSDTEVKARGTMALKGTWK